MLLQDKPSTRLLDRLSRIAASIIAGLGLVSGLLLLFAAQVRDIKAAPPFRPLTIIITDPISVTHTNATTHTMRVFANGRLTDQFFTDDGTPTTPSLRNQIDQLADDPAGTTIAVLFDQHPVTNQVDVGAQGDFVALTPITLNTSSTIPGYSEDTQALYASQVLPYQITQRTLATTTINCVLVELVIQNTGSQTLTGGRLLYMLDVDAAHSESGDLGGYDPAKRFLYITDFNVGSPAPGFGVGAALLQGELAGYRVNGDPGVFSGGNSYPTTDAELRTEMLTPTNTITDGDNDVLWLVATIPTLVQAQETTLVFSLCAQNGPDEAQVIDDIIDNQQKLIKFSAIKTVTPAIGSTGQPVTYTISLVNNGVFYIDNVIVTDTLPASVNLVDYSVSQGTITAGNGLITATIGRLFPTGQPVNITIVVTPSTSLPNGAVIANQAFVSSNLFFTQTNIITHQIRSPVITVVKQASPDPVEPGAQLLYTILLHNPGQVDAFGVVVSDTLPTNTSFVSGSLTLTPAGATGTPPALVNNLTIPAGQTVTVTFAVVLTSPLTSGTLIINTAGITSPQLASPVNDTVTSTVVATPTLNITKSGPVTATVGDTIVFTFTVTNAGRTLLQNLVVVDNIAGPATFVSGGDGDNLLELTETWLYTVAYLVSPMAADPLINIVTVTATDLGGSPAVATATHTTDLAGFAPVLFVDKDGPASAIVGQTVTYMITVINYSDMLSALSQFDLDPIELAAIEPGDGSPIRITSVTDNITDPPVYVSGDTGIIGMLDAGEGWVYAVSYTVQVSGPLINQVQVQGLDREDDPLSAQASHIISVFPEPIKYFLPVVLKKK